MCNTKWTKAETISYTDMRRIDGFAGEYEEGDDWAEKEEWSQKDIEYFEESENKMLSDGFTKPYTASMMAKLKEQRK